MKLSKWAKEKGISYITAYRWAKSGNIPGTQIMPNGTILINDVNSANNDSKNIFIYARVSSNDRKRIQIVIFDLKNIDNFAPHLLKQK